jgi:hypothetical protein
VKLRIVLATVVALSVSCGGGDRAGDRAVLQNKGSDTLVNVAQAWAEAYGQVRPEVAVAVSGGGSGTGGDGGGRKLMWELRGEYTILIVTHNMAQARRASEETIFMLMGKVIEHGLTDDLFFTPKHKETADYIEGRYG